MFGLYKIIFHTQEMVVWGWDPKEVANHFGYQGTHVGYPFTASSASSSAECIVWLTGEEAFLECVQTTELAGKRTSAGIWGYGHWKVISPKQSC